MALIGNSLIRRIIRVGPKAFLTTINVCKQTSGTSFFDNFQYHVYSFMSLRSIRSDLTLAKNAGNDSTTFQNDKARQKKEMRNYTKEEDSIILKKVQELGYNNPETWKQLCKILGRKYAANIK